MRVTDLIVSVGATGWIAQEVPFQWSIKPLLFKKPMPQQSDVEAQTTPLR